MVAKSATFTRMEPASSIITKLGGPTKVGREIGVHRVSVSKWMAPKPSGTGGVIPFKHVPGLLKIAKGLGVPLSADDFLPKAGA